VPKIISTSDASRMRYLFFNENFIILFSMTQFLMVVTCMGI